MTKVRSKKSYINIVDDVEREYSGVLNLPNEVIRMIISSYLLKKADELKNGKIIEEPLGESRLTIRKTNSRSNNGLSAKVVTSLSKEMNDIVCSRASVDSDYMQLLKC